MHAIRREMRPDGVCVLTLDRPNSSANVFDRATLEELNARLDELGDARALILTGAKDAIFVAGADLHSIKAMGADELDEFIALGQNVFNKLARLPIPTVAAVHGAALGGGCEVCLACDWRVASSDRATKLGLPETKLGIIPGWGGSTRLPRLIGVPKALDIILGGKSVSAKRALQLGMIHDVAPREYLIRAALNLIRNGKPKHSLLHSAAVNAVVGTLLRAKVRADVQKKTRGQYPAVLEALEVITHGAAGSEEASLARERQAIRKLIGLESTQNLLRLFFLQERAKKLKAPGAVSRTGSGGLTHAAVIGAGIMGAGIAQWLSARGLRVILRDIDANRVAAGMSNISRIYADAVRHRVLTAHEARVGMERVSPAPALVPLGNVGIVIEAAVEKLEIKKSIFRGLDESTGADAILATNTSALSISELAGATRHPERVIGIHFFNPVHKMQLVEVVVGRATTPQTADAALRFVQRIGKLPVLVKDSPGFLVNRVLLPYMVEAGMLFERGADVAEIDEAMLEFGMPMGPLRLIDEVGVDIAEDVAKTLAAAFPERLRVPAVLGKMIAQGLLGKKSGSGFYVHAKGAEGKVNPAVGQLRSGAMTASRDALRQRMVLPMINEAAYALQERIVDDPADIDFAMVMGTGFAPFRGGPLRYADSLGTASVTEDLLRLAETLGPHYRPCPLLCEMNGQTFYED